jgi:hypothetical protein
VVETIVQGYKFNPRDKKFLAEAIPAIRNDLQTRLSKAKTIDEINKIILIYLEQIVAIQNLMFQQFVRETLMESRVTQPPQPQPQSSPQPAGRRSIVGNWVGMWDRSDGGIRIVQQGNDFIAYVTQVPPQITGVLRPGEALFVVKSAGRGYEGEILKIYTYPRDYFRVMKGERLRCIVELLNNNNLRVVIVAPGSTPTYELKAIIK